MTNSDQLWISKAWKLVHPTYHKVKALVPESWLVGLMYVENSKMDLQATRFEQGVYDATQQVVAGHTPPSFPGFVANPSLKKWITSSNEACKILSTSYGLIQIMGYNYVSNFNLSMLEIIGQSLEANIKYSLGYLDMEKQGCATYEELCRKHNTGKIHGVTFNPSYVGNAERIRKLYEQYLEGDKKLKFKA